MLFILEFYLRYLGKWENTHDFKAVQLTMIQVKIRAPLIPIHFIVWNANKVCAPICCRFACITSRNQLNYLINGVSYGDSFLYLFQLLSIFYLRFSATFRMRVVKLKSHSQIQVLFNSNHFWTLDFRNYTELRQTQRFGFVPKKKFFVVRRQTHS